MIDRRGFFRNALAGGAGLSLMGSSVWEAAAQFVENPQLPLRDIRGIGLDDPELVELSINENPLGSSRRAIEEVAKRMFGMNRYPFHDEMEEALAKHHGVGPENVLVGVGSTEVLHILTMARFHGAGGGNTVTAFPSYPYVPRKTEDLGREVKKVPLLEDWGIDLEGMANAVDAETRIVSVCNPNNPTGQVLDARALRSFLSSMPDDVVVCVDEAYIDFVEGPEPPTMIPHTKDLENVIVTRTFSKAHGLGGARIGYGIASPALLETLTRFGMGALNKNALSIAAALGALSDMDHVRRTVEAVREGKAFLYSELEGMGYEPIRTQTIFVTVEVGEKLDSFVELLRERKVKVRQAFDMEGYMRISCGLPRENEAFVEEFRRLAQPN